MKKISIVNEIIENFKIKLYDENKVEITLCEKSPFLYVIPFKQPYIRYDVFAKKTTKPAELVFITNEELDNYGYSIYTMTPTKKWYPRQRVMYVIGDKNVSYAGASKISRPPGIKVQKDKANNLLRLVGKNAGPIHNEEEGGSGNWVKIKDAV